MALSPEMLQVLGDIDQDLNKVAAYIASLRAKVKTGMSPEDVTLVHAALTSVETRLKATAADPDEPIPQAPLPPVR